MKKIISLIIICYSLSGCVSPETRIENNLAVFNTATVIQQNQIKEGKIDVGFNSAMVKLALGDPDSVTTRTDNQGQTIIWHYYTSYSNANEIWFSGYPYRRYYYHPIIVENTYVEKITVYLQNDKVISFDENK